LDLIEINFNNKFRHPWELSRSENILSILKKQKNITYADIGAGDLFFSNLLKKSLKADVTAVDIHFIENSKLEKQNTNGITQLNSLDELTNCSVDCIVLMDVIEHVENDILFLGQASEKLKSGGNILITVPAFQFLFSNHDKAMKHFRRYNKTQLTYIANQCGLEIKECFYFYFSLWIVRVFSKYLFPFSTTYSKKSNVENWKFSEQSPITSTIKTILNFDFYICKTLSHLGITIPGLSLCLVCKKKSV
jgi:SAM-dependent methyltransferase